MPNMVGSAFYMISDPCRDSLTAGGVVVVEEREKNDEESVFIFLMIFVVL